jgi:OOP family OmpA-OmpF porin
MKNVNLFPVLILVVFLLLFAPNELNAQHTTQRNGLSLKFLLIDYYSSFKNEPVYEFQNLTYGGEVGYFRNINSFMNIGVPLRVGIANLPQDTAFSDDKLFASLDAVLQFHLMKEDRLFNPYLFGGGGAFYDEDENISFHFPLGGGFNLRLTSNWYLQAQTEFRKSLEDNRDNWHHSAGFLFLLGKGSGNSSQDERSTDSDGDGVPNASDDCPYAAGPAFLGGCPDSDGDGIIDKKDKCPNEAGDLAADGCPDSDGDGVPDNIDNCPEDFGTRATGGCPDSDGDGVPDDVDNCPDESGSSATGGCPDSDGDGIADKDDDCPDQFGSALAGGCPDRDGDGVPDREDRCPDEAGSRDSNGCPGLSDEEVAVLEEAKGSVEFDPNRATIRKESLPILDQIATIMNRRTTYSLKIHGHTDSVGSSDFNQQLSEARAKACFDYLVSKGVRSDRMTYAGFGESQPIADNALPEGQRLNRRVEFIMERK